MTCSFIFQLTLNANSCLSIEAKPILSTPTFPLNYIFQLFSNPQNLFHCFHWHHFKPYLQKQSMCLTGWGWGREGFHSHCSDIGKGEEKEDTLSWSKKKTIYYFRVVK